MKQKIIENKKYEKACHNCFYGRMPKDNESVLCEKKGNVDPYGKCRHYQYDPLKRKPDRLVVSKDFDENDFKL